MAKRKVFLMIGSSQMAGFNSRLTEVPVADFVRWAGQTLPPTYPIAAANKPYQVTVPGVRMFTVRRPYSTNLTRLQDTVVAAPPIYDYVGGASNAQKDQWVYVANQAPANLAGTASGAQGQLGRLTADAAAATFTLTANFPIAPKQGDTYAFLMDSRTISGITDVMLNGVMRTVITKTSGGDADFDVNDIGRFVVFPKSFTAGNLNFNYSSKIVAQTAITITLERYYGDPTIAITGLQAGDPLVVCSGANSCTTMAGISSTTSTLQDLQFYLDDTGPAFLTGLDYNTYDGGTIFQSPLCVGNSITLPTINCIPELTWRLRQKFSDPIVVLQIGVSSSMISPFFIASNTVSPLASSAGFGSFSWAHDIVGLDFSPGGSGSNCYTALVNSITALKALLIAEGNEADFDTCFINLSDNDQANADRLTHIGDNMLRLRNALRAITGNPSMKWVMAGPNRTYSGTVGDNIYAQLTQVKNDDAYSWVLDERGNLNFSVDGAHYNAAGQIQLGKDFFTGYEAVVKKANDAARVLAELPTLATLRTRVRRRYERNSAGNDATVAQVDQFINDSLSEFYNGVGDDKAWFTRRVEQFDLAGGLFPNTINLPRTVKRLLRIEVATSPGRPLTWRSISYTDEGRIQVTLYDSITGPFNVHFIALTQPLTVDTDVAILPEEYTELVVMLACKRLTECSGNVVMAQYYAAESERLWKMVKRSCQLHDRMRQPQMEMLGAYDSWTNGAWQGGDEWGL
jgi:hypothetical protein